MIRRLAVTGYQSLVDVALDLEPLTVIVGPSSSGKSALVRALRAVPTYQRGSSFLSAHGGTQSAEIALTLEAPARGIPGPVTVTVSRGQDNAYRLAFSPGEPPVVFTKLSGATPPEVSHVLGMPPDSTLSIAAQFDPPYLLAASPGEAHGTLARLTGVTTLLRASREANRRRLASLTSARTLTTTLEGIRSTLGETTFSGLEARLDILADARQARARLVTRLERLAILSTAHAAHDRLAALRENHDRLARVLSADVPALDKLAELTARRDTVAAARDRLAAARSTLDRLARDRDAAATALEAATAERDAIMRAGLSADVCPMCGQAMSPVRAIVET